MSTRSRSRLLWSVLDQAVSSLSNYLLLILLVRSASLADVGAYGLAYTTYFLCQAVCRGAISDPLLVRHATGTGEPLRGRSTALGASLVLSGALGGAVSIAALGVGGQWAAAFLTFAAVTPGLVLQDTVRMVLFGEGRPRGALMSDLLFLSVQVAVYVVLHVLEAVSPAALVAGWGGSGLLAALAGLLGLRCLPRLGGLAGDWRANHDLIPAYVADYLANRGAEQLTLVAVALTAGSPAVGVVTSARALFAPLGMVQTGLNAHALPEVSRRYREGDREQAHAFVLMFAAGMGALMLVAGTGLWALPEPWGRHVLAGNWEPVSERIVPMAVFSALNAVGFALWLGGRAAQRATGVLVARAGSGAVMVIGAGVGATWAGATGAVWGMSVGAAAMCVLLLGVLRRVR